jgi:hypothetical protein
MRNPWQSDFSSSDWALVLEMMLVLPLGAGRLRDARVDGLPLIRKSPGGTSCCPGHPMGRRGCDAVA